MSGADLDTTALFAAVVRWIAATGARDLIDQPNIWTGESGDWVVTMNPRLETWEGYDPLEVRIEHKTLFACMAVTDPHGGGCIGVTEDELLAHFAAEAARLEAASEGAPT